MSETSVSDTNKLSRRQFLRLAGSAALAVGLKAMMGDGSAQAAQPPSPTEAGVKSLRYKKEIAHELPSPVSITGVVIPLENGGNVSTTGLAIEAGRLGNYQSTDIESITIVVNEPDPSVPGLWELNQEAIARQTSAGLRDPAQPIAETGRVINNSAAIVYVPIIGTFQANYEEQINKLGIEVIRVGRDDTLQEPSPIRDLRPGTMFIVTLQVGGQAGITDTYEVGPYN